MATLPTPGGDAGTWGDELNEFLLVAHNSNGTQDASDVIFAPAGTIAATNVQAAIEEVSAEAGGTTADNENLILHMALFS